MYLATGFSYLNHPQTVCLIDFWYIKGNGSCWIRSNKVANFSPEIRVTPANSSPEKHFPPITNRSQIVTYAKTNPESLTASGWISFKTALLMPTQWCVVFREQFQPTNSPPQIRPFHIRANFTIHKRFCNLK